MARTHSKHKGGSKRIYKKPGRLSARKQYQIWKRNTHPLKPRPGGSNHAPA